MVCFGFSCKSNCRCYSNRKRCVTWLSRFLSSESDTLYKHILVIYVATFVVILPLMFHNSKYSVYFAIYNKTQLNGIYKHENAARVTEANKYLDMIDRSKLHSMLDKREGNSSGVDVAISIITVSRNDEMDAQYLTQVVWKLLVLLHNLESNGYYDFTTKVVVCNVDSDPENYEEAKKISKLIPVFNRFNKLSLPIDHILEREKQDYVYCLNLTMPYNPRYSLLIEDDALPRDNFFEVLGYTMKTHLEPDRYYRGTDSRVGPDLTTYIKLYHPERLQGYWSPEPERIPELISISVFFGSIATWVYMYFCTHPTTKNTYNFVLGIFVVYFLLIQLTVSRTHILDLRQYFSPYLHYYLPAAECCTPAVLFPRAGAERVIDYLDKVTCGRHFGKDIALEQMKEVQGVKGYQVQPNIATHIGLYSSLRKAFVNPFIV